MEWELNAQKMFPIKDFFSKCDQIRSFLGIWLNLLKKSLIENFIFCTLTSLSCWSQVWCFTRMAIIDILVIHLWSLSLTLFPFHLQNYMTSPINLASKFNFSVKKNSTPSMLHIVYKLYRITYILNSEWSFKPLQYTSILKLWIFERHLRTSTKGP